MATPFDNRLRSQVNGAISNALRSRITDIGDGRGINLMDISLVNKDITEIVDRAMEVVYTFGVEDGMKQMMDSIGGKGGEKTERKETTVRS